MDDRPFAHEKVRRMKAAAPLLPIMRNAPYLSENRAAAAVAAREICQDKKTGTEAKRCNDSGYLHTSSCLTFTANTIIVRSCFPGQCGYSRNGPQLNHELCFSRSISPRVATSRIAQMCLHKQRAGAVTAPPPPID